MFDIVFEMFCDDCNVLRNILEMFCVIFSINTPVTIIDQSVECVLLMINIIVICSLFQMMKGLLAAEVNLAYFTDWTFSYIILSNDHKLMQSDIVLVAKYYFQCY